MRQTSDVFEKKSSLGSASAAVSKCSLPTGSPVNLPILAPHRVISFLHIVVLSITLNLSLGQSRVALAKDNWSPFADREGIPSSRPKPAHSLKIAPRQVAPPQPHPAPTYGSSASGHYSTPASPPYAPSPYRPASGTAGTYLPQASPQGSGGSAGTGKLERRELAPVQPINRANTHNATPQGSQRGSYRSAPSAALSGTSAWLDPNAWSGLDTRTIEQLITSIRRPNRSRTLHTLWLKLLTAQSPNPGDPRLTAIKAEALYREGALDAAAIVLSPKRQEKLDTIILALRARIKIAQGDTKNGCRNVKPAAARIKKLPKVLRGEVLVLAGYCAAIASNREGAGIAAELARNVGYSNRFALSLLEAIASGRRTMPNLPKRISLIDKLLITAAKIRLPKDLIKRAKPALLVDLSQATNSDTLLRIGAAEQAVRTNILPPIHLARAYLAHQFPPALLAAPLGVNVTPALRRALLFQVASVDRAAFQRTRLIRALIDDARRTKLRLPALVIAKPLIDELPRAPEIGWFAETAIEAALAAGDPKSARSWTIFSAALGGNRSGTLEHWRSLIDIAHGPRQSLIQSTVDDRKRGSLAALENLVQRGRFSGPMLHRLATVLDALDYNVPMPLWEAANATPQPKTGHLPATGVLSQLQQASRKRQTAHVVLLSIRTLGPEGTTNAHMIALGDTIRAMKRAGHEPEARQLAFEALFESWPRVGNN